jgi:alpha-beta hydrolase superfamily lysophospholipase/thiol-disulfide isomerase/thioredoxin
MAALFRIGGKSSMKTLRRILIAWCLVLLTGDSLFADEPVGSVQSPPTNTRGELRRRPLFGAQFAAVTAETRARHKLTAEGGVQVEHVFPDTAAASAEIKAGNVILTLNGKAVTGTRMILDDLAALSAGDEIMLGVIHDGTSRDVRATLKEMPREMGDGYEVIYTSVTSHGARLRTILTRPKREGRQPAVMLLQGGGDTCFSIDNPVGEPFGFTKIARGLAKQGFVTLRMERPGCGDSEGGPLRDVDFDTELDGYKEALRSLKALDFVDADNVFLFGHSMGGIMAPLAACDVPVRGIAVYGTASGTWFESVFEQRRRLATVDGTKAEDVDREILKQARLLYPLLVEMKTPREIREQHTDLPAGVWEQWIADDLYVFGRHYRFAHQLAAKNLSEAWAKIAGTDLSGKATAESPTATRHPSVLAIWGTSDWMATRAQQSWIAEVVNRVAPGNGRFVALDSTDHFFFRVESPEASFRILKPSGKPTVVEFNPAIVETLHDWIKATVQPNTLGQGKAESTTDMTGTWQLVERREGGQVTPAGSASSTLWIASKEEIVQVADFWEQHYTLQVRSGGPLAHVDLTPIDPNGRQKWEARACLAAIANDRLTITWPDPKSPGTRPITNGTDKSETSVWVFDRYRERPADVTAERELAAILKDWQRAENAYWSERKIKSEEELAAPFSELANRCLLLAKAHPSSTGGLAALCLAALNAPDTQGGREALAALQNGGVAQAKLRGLRRALDAADRPGLAQHRQTEVPALIVKRVRQALDDPHAAWLLNWACCDGPIKPPPEPPKHYIEAADLIVSEFASSPDIGGFSWRLGNFNGSAPWAGQFERGLRVVLKENRHAEVRKSTLFALATLVDAAGEARQEEAEAFFRQFLAEFEPPSDSDKRQPSNAKSPRDRHIELARINLERLGVLGVGKPAPDIVGEDLDGKPMKLSDFRGKVVLVSFWFTGCVPCMKLIPHERELATRLKDQPFAIVGVNSDDEPDVVRQAIEKHGISWRSFKNSRPERAPISREWKVEGWPNIYLIDHKGVIRKRWLDAPPAEQLDREVERLMEAVR